MRLSTLILSTLLFVSVLSWGQGSSGEDLLRSLSREGEQSQVSIATDSLLEVNYYKLMVVNSKVKGVPGYRIRIFSESGINARAQLQNERVRFHTIFPEIATYDDYDGVYFKLYVGDCRTRSEALKLYDLIEEEFPDPIIREEYIKIK